MSFVWIDENLCTRCLFCAAVCPNRVFSWDGNELDIRFQGRCIECGHCVAVCPSGAFHHSKLAPEGCIEIPKPYPVSPEVLQSVFALRRSCRRFLKEPITDENRIALFDAAAYAPTATNSRNVRFIALDTEQQIDLLERATSTYYLKLEKQLGNPIVRFFISLTVGKKVVDAYKYHLPIIVDRFRASMRGEESIFYGAPLVIIAYASGLGHIAAANCNLAVMQMMQKAEALGLATCYNGYVLTALVRDRQVRKAVGIPKGYHPAAVLAVGRPAVHFCRAPKRRPPRVSSGG
jgi:nitroreductase/NAD-dependent dihydropyrimidine dehydrogenase PreA subunit